MAVIVQTSFQYDNGATRTRADDEAAAQRRQALGAEKSKVQQTANTVRGMEPNSRALLDLAECTIWGMAVAKYA